MLPQTVVYVLVHSLPISGSKCSRHGSVSRTSRLWRLRKNTRPMLGRNVVTNIKLLPVWSFIWIIYSTLVLEICHPFCLLTSLFENDNSLEVTLLQLEKLYGKSKASQEFISSLIRGDFAANVSYEASWPTPHIRFPIRILHTSDF